MKYDDADWTDLLYAPGLSFKGDGSARWNAPTKYTRAGYRPASITLKLPGHIDDQHKFERAYLCREHTKKMLAWWKEQEAAGPIFGTWSYLIHRYRTDTYSPYQDLKANTQTGYDTWFDMWDNAIGTKRIKDTTYKNIRIIEQKMKKEGRSLSYISRVFTHLRLLASYGCLIPELKDHCVDIRFILSRIRIKTPASKAIAPSRQEVEAIIAAADAQGSHVLAVGMILQFELCLRAFDVFGQWVKAQDYDGFTRNGKRWIDGMTWDMFSDDCTTVSKVVSKTEGSMPEPYTFDLTPIPGLVERLQALRGDLYKGPVLRSEHHHVPYSNSGINRLFKKAKKAAGIDRPITLRDLRAGALTEAKMLNIPMAFRRDAAQHVHETTTDIYSRDRSQAANIVVQIRQEARQSLPDPRDARARTLIS